MRTVDRPFAVTIENGAIRFECGGAATLIDPAAADALGRRMIAGADATRRRIGERLVASAATIAAPPLRAAA